MAIPANLTLLHDGEEKLRDEALSLIQADEDANAHLAMIEKVMDLIHALLPSSEENDEDQLVLGNIGIRCFNALASMLKLALAGYYQASAMHIRDLLETAFLLDHFSTDSSFITQWRTMPEKERKKAFGPFAVRDALDRRDGFTTMKRKIAYEQLCQLAGHVTPEGAVMLVPDSSKKAVQCGPFVDDTALFAVLAEAAMTGVQAGTAFRRLMRTNTLQSHEARVSYMHDRAEWLFRFFDQEIDRAGLEAARQLLLKARAAAAKVSLT